MILVFIWLTHKMLSVWVTCSSVYQRQVKEYQTLKTSLIRFKVCLNPRNNAGLSIFNDIKAFKNECDVIELKSDQCLKVSL